MLKTLWRSRRGATAIEYGLIAALVAIPVVGAMTGLGTKVAATFVNFASYFRLT